MPTELANCLLDVAQRPQWPDMNLVASLVQSLHLLGSEALETTVESAGTNGFKNAVQATFVLLGVSVTADDETAGHRERMLAAQGQRLGLEAGEPNACCVCRPAKDQFGQGRDCAGVFDFDVKFNTGCVHDFAEGQCWLSGIQQDGA